MNRKLRIGLQIVAILLLSCAWNVATADGSHATPEGMEGNDTVTPTETIEPAQTGAQEPRGTATPTPESGGGPYDTEDCYDPQLNLCDDEVLPNDTDHVDQP